MKYKVLLLGATGLIGRTFLDIAENKKQIEDISIVTRRQIELSSPNFKHYIINFNALSEFSHLINADIIVCTLGTTLKKAGSREVMRDIDYRIPLKIAEYAGANGTSYYILVSSIGADPGSQNFYLSIKGELERDLSRLGFKGLHILRPSLLLGARDESRPGEKVAQIVAPVYSWLLPHPYKPIKAEAVASKIHSVCLNPGDGIFIYSGKDLY